MCSPTFSWGPAGRIPWTPCGLQGRSVGHREHIYYGIFEFYCFAEAETAVHAGEEDTLSLTVYMKFLKTRLYADCMPAA